jgi:hypothetical protein
MHKPLTEAQKKADIKELNKEPLKEAIMAKTTHQALAILSQELLDLSADLKIKGAPSHAEKCQQLSDLAQEQLTALGHPDKRREPEVTKEKKKITTFRPVLDEGRQAQGNKRKITKFTPVSNTKRPEA